YHEFHEPATNERLGDIAAALGSSQCRRLQSFKAARQGIVDRYRAACADLPWIRMPRQPTDHDPFWHLCIAHCDWKGAGADRQALFAAGREQGIAFQVHYIPLHHQPVLADAPRAGPLCGADAAYAAAVSLPCHPGLCDADQDRVIRCLRCFGT
ncbi:MAG: DegT/DnrJ/EryC1/StrS family aminotransferase, partial [Planctomycetota bacterium]